VSDPVSIEAAPPPGPLSPEVRQRVAELRKDRRSLRRLFDLLSTYLLILGALFVAWRVAEWWAFAGAFVVVGMMQYRLVMSSHEAVHKNLLDPVWLNEVFGNLNAAMVGISFLNYRKTHLEHHKSPQYIRDDTDAYIYKPLLEARPGLPRLALLVFGVWLDIWVKLKRKAHGVGPSNTEAGSISPPSQLWLIASVQLGLLAAFTLLWDWKLYFLLWFAPIFCIALAMDRARTFVEHGYHYLFSQNSQKVGEALQATVDIRTNPLEAYFLAPFGFDYHQAHHSQLTVPYYNLRHLSDLLRTNDPRYNSLVEGSYVGILCRMIWAAK